MASRGVRKADRNAAMRLTATDLAAVRGGRAVFQARSFVVGAGQLLAVVGPNGSGKSTLLRLVAGLLTPAAGAVSLDPAPDGGVGEAAHYLGHLDALKATLTVRDNLDFWLRLSGGEGSVAAALDTVGLGHVADLPAGILSAGQKRRVAIARLLLASRPLWLLDEPATALDAAAEATLGTLIAAHLAGGGLAIAATHRDLPLPPHATLDLGKP
jgi:heme exporter protein A